MITKHIINQFFGTEPVRLKKSNKETFHHFIEDPQQIHFVF